MCLIGVATTNTGTCIVNIFSHTAKSTIFWPEHMVTLSRQCCRVPSSVNLRRSSSFKSQCDLHNLLGPNLIGTIFYIFKIEVEFCVGPKNCHHQNFLEFGQSIRCSRFMYLKKFHRQRSGIF